MSERDDTTPDGLPLDPVKREAAVDTLFEGVKAQLAALSTKRVYSLRAKHQGEALAHCITRAAFLRQVAGDPRTNDLFRWWGRSTGVDAVVDDMIALLVAAAHRAGLAHWSALRKQENAYHLIPILGLLQRHEEHYERLLAETREERVRFAIGWVVAELYGTVVDEQVPIRTWLASDLITIFRWRVAGNVYGESIPMLVGQSPTLEPVQKGQRPKRRGEHLERNAGWYYRAHVAASRVTHAELAREDRARKDAAGVFLSPKESKDITERADTSTVRDGIGEAKRLLELTIPPDKWIQYFTI